MIVDKGKSGIVQNLAFSGGTNPLSMTFSRVLAERHTFLEADTIFTENFEGAAVNWNLLGADGTNPLQNSKLHFANGGTSFLQFLTRAVGPFRVCRTTITAAAATSGSSVLVGCGLLSDANNFIFAWYDVHAQQVQIQQNVSSTQTTLGTANITLTAPFDLIIQADYNAIKLWVNRGNGDELLVNVMANSFPDLSLITNLNAYLPTIGKYMPGGSGDSADVGKFRYSHSGTISFREPHAITWPDGTPLVIDNEAYFTATNDLANGYTLEADEFKALEHMYWAIYAMDLNTFRIRQTGGLFVQVGSNIFGMLDGKIIIDPSLGTNGKWRVWSGNQAYDVRAESGVVKIYYYETFDDILHGFHVLPQGTLVTTLDAESYNMDIVQIPGTTGWTMACTSNSTLNVRLSRGTSPTNFSINLGTNTPASLHEGACLRKINGTYYILIGETGTGKIAVYDMTCTLLGYLTLPANFTSSGIASHPDLYQINRNGQTVYVMQTFNVTQFSNSIFWSYGCRNVAVCDQLATGYEHPNRSLALFGR